jgi:glucose-1-phosphate thymidylyltransferase
MVYYPLSTLMLAGIRDILIISTPQDTPRFEQLLGDGSAGASNLSYAVQPSTRRPRPGLHHRRRTSLASRSVLRPGAGRQHLLTVTISPRAPAAGGRQARRAPPCFAYPVNDPQRYGVVEFDRERGMPSAWRKSLPGPKSRFAVTGLYFYDNEVVSVARSLKPSARGELEITDVNRVYLESRCKLDVATLGSRPGVAGHRHTRDPARGRPVHCQCIERRQGLKVCCPGGNRLARRNGLTTMPNWKQLASSAQEQRLRQLSAVILLNDARQGAN